MNDSSNGSNGNSKKKLGSTVLEKWVPPFIAGVLAGAITVTSTVWLEPMQKKSLAIFEDKRAASREIQSAFSSFLISLRSYDQHMATMGDVDESNESEVAAFREIFTERFNEFSKQTKNLAYTLAAAEIYFSPSVTKEFRGFRDFHRESDEIMQTEHPRDWLPVDKYLEWRERIVLSIRNEIVRGTI